MHLEVMEIILRRLLYLRRHAPFLIAFEERAQVFQTVIAADRDRRREMGAYGPQTFVTIHRDTLMQVRIITRISSGKSSTSLMWHAQVTNQPLKGMR